MKKPRIVIAAAFFALALGAVPALGATASGTSFTLQIGAVGSGANEIGITRSGNSFVIDSNGPIPPPTDGSTHKPLPGCVNPPANPDQLRCAVARINGFYISVGGGNDIVNATKSVTVPTEMIGGAGLDDLYGGSNTDKLIGGADGDKLVGRGSSDALYGGAGEDLLLGGAGNDLLRGGAGLDVLKGGPGRDDERQ